MKVVVVAGVPVAAPVVALLSISKRVVLRRLLNRLLRIDLDHSIAVVLLGIGLDRNIAVVLLLFQSFLEPVLRLVEEI